MLLSSPRHSWHISFCSYRHSILCFWIFSSSISLNSSLPAFPLFSSFSRLLSSPHFPSLLFLLPIFLSLLSPPFSPLFSHLLPFSPFLPYPLFLPLHYLLLLSVILNLSHLSPRLFFFFYMFSFSQAFSSLPYLFLFYYS